MTPPTRPRLQTLLASMLALCGAGLMAMMIATESEPGAIPLLMVVIGLGWLGVTRPRIRRRRD